MTTIVIQDITRDEIIAQGQTNEAAILLESAYYFEPGDVKQDHLIISDRTYTCPYKGVCRWVDLNTPDGIIQNVGWIYHQPHPNYEHIRDKFGFAFGTRPGIIVKKQ